MADLYGIVALEQGEGLALAYELMRSQEPQRMPKGCGVDTLACHTAQLTHVGHQALRSLAPDWHTFLQNEPPVQQQMSEQCQRYVREHVSGMSESMSAQIPLQCQQTVRVHVRAKVRAMLGPYHGGCHATVPANVGETALTMSGPLLSDMIA